MSWELHGCAVRGDVAGIRKGLAAGLNPNEKDEVGWTPLHHAAAHDSAAVIEPLVEGGANQEITDRDGQHPIHVAASENSLAAARELIRCQAGNTIHRTHGGNLTPLMVAYSRGHAKMVELLKQHGGEERLDDRQREFIAQCMAKRKFQLVLKLVAVAVVVYLIARWTGVLGG